jgi:hypothetical protein
MNADSSSITPGRSRPVATRMAFSLGIVAAERMKIDWQHGFYNRDLPIRC